MDVAELLDPVLVVLRLPGAVTVEVREFELEVVVVEPPPPPPPPS